VKIKLMTDAPKHNLALMRISAWHKAKGDEVFLGKPGDEFDLSYGSWLFSHKYPTFIMGGMATTSCSERLSDYGIPENIMPDYSLYPNLDYSLGYTWEWCPRKCEFCFVHRMNPPKVHHSIFEFHNPNFSKICLLNNNTFSDPDWRETFQEIWDTNLTLIEHGFDLRLLDQEKVDYLNKTKIEGLLHFAWDCPEDEKQIRQGLEILKSVNHPIHIYVLVGYPGWRPINETDISRCKIINEYGFDPYIMVYNRHIKSRSPKKRMLNQYQRMVNRCFTWRKLGFQKAWEEYSSPRQG
jgi:hypothetical protein